MVTLKTLMPLVVLTSQVVQALRFYTDEGCDLDLTNPDSTYDDFGNPPEQQGEDGEMVCRTMHWKDDDWPIDGAVERKVVYFDHDGIEEGCKLLLYHPPDSSDPTDGHCMTQYISFGSTGPCSRATIPNPVGYSYCCGGGCGEHDTASLFPDLKAKREVQEPPPVEELFENTRSSKRTVLDPVDIKRRAPLERFSVLDKRDECTWVNQNDDDQPYEKRPGQYKVAPVTLCTVADGCSGSVTMSYSASVTEEFGVEAGMGATLLEVMSISMSFSYSQSTSETTTTTYEAPYSLELGQRGYLAWNPILECAYGSFTGDCDEWDSNVEGEACFLKMLGSGIPDGEFITVVENA